MVAEKLNHQRTNVATKEKSAIIQFPKKHRNVEQSGKSHLVYPLQVDDAKKILKYLEENGRWLPYLLFVLSCNTGRRSSDILALKWENIFNPVTGEIRTKMKAIKEKKTGKYIEPLINGACRVAIQKYIDKTGCDPAKNHYQELVSMQVYGNYKGRPLGYASYLKTIKSAAQSAGIQYNVGTHSCRKMFGAVTMMLHPETPDKVETLQLFYNHSDQKTTTVYIGDVDKKIDGFVDDYGKFFMDHVIGDEEFIPEDPESIVSYNIRDIHSLIQAAYSAGQRNASEVNPIVHVESTANLIAMAEELAR